MCVRVRERVCAGLCARDRERERDRVRVCVRESEGERQCVSERGGECA